MLVRLGEEVEGGHTQMAWISQCLAGFWGRALVRCGFCGMSWQRGTARLLLWTAHF